MAAMAPIRRLSAASIAGQLCCLAIVVVASLLEPGYSEIRDAISMLGATDAARPWTFDVAVTVWGLSLLAAAAALTLDAPPTLRGRLGPTLIAFTGLAQILDGFPFPAQCRPTIDAGCHARELAGELPWQHYAHGWAYFLGAVALMASVFAMAWRFHGDDRWGRSDLLALGGGVIGLAIFSVPFFATSDTAADGYYGLVQRLTLAAAGIWVGALTVGLLAVYGRPADLAHRFVAWLRTLPGGWLAPEPGAGLDAPGPGADARLGPISS
jgi:Protein of unknown function (DUF998)